MRVLVSFVVIGLVLAALPVAAARTQHAVLWLDTGGDGPSRAVLLETDIAMEVLGMVAFAEVRQTYRNDTDAWAEARFVFPLPDQAAVDRMSIRVGARLIEGEIQERGEAQATYRKARQEGRRAGLVEQERANLFTTSVANIGPGEEIELRIGFQQPVRYVDGRFSLRLPLAFVPRFVPGVPLPRSKEASEADLLRMSDTDEVPDASRITPPIQHPAAGPLHPLTLDVVLHAGFELATIESTHHRIRQTRDGSAWRIGLEDGAVAPDRDFELTWTPRDAGHAQSAIYRERRGDHDYVLMMLVPPHSFRADATPREVTLIVDSSGSMRGAPIAQARGALHVALAALRPKDRFNLIEFNSVTRSLFPAPVTAEPAALEEAARFVDGLKAHGGTVMGPALTRALAGPAAPGYLRQVVFVTDGAVGNDQALLDRIQREVGEARLFTVGIGHGVNDHFMRKAAELGGGGYTFIAEQGDIESRMIELLTRLTSPVLHGIELDLPAAAETYPRRIPDLYVGEPVLAVARMPSAGGVMEAGGLSDGRVWKRHLNLDQAMPVPGVAKLWARRRIEALTDARGDGADRAMIREEITTTAIEYQLLSPYTSLVAVERVPVRPAWEALAQHDLPRNLPHGRRLDGIVGNGFGRALPRTAAGIDERLRNGLVWLFVALVILALQRWRSAAA